MQREKYIHGAKIITNYCEILDFELHGMIFYVIWCYADMKSGIFMKVDFMKI